MKPHPTPHRIRKTIKWGGLAVTVLLVGVWIQAALFPSHLSMGVLPIAAGSGGHVVNHNLRASPVAVYSIRTLFWIPAMLVLIPTLIAWRLDTLARRRERANLCPKCNYDRTGLASGAKCPECGAAPVENS